VRKGPSMTDAERAFTHHVMFTEGIVPMEDPAIDIRKALETLPPDEARKMKRKFRKLWRKYMRMQEAKRLKQTRWQGQNAVVLGKGTKSPTRNHKLQRKQLVVDVLRQNVILPAVKAFNEIPKQTPETEK
jgi:hypothetical protein